MLRRSRSKPRIIVAAVWSLSTSHGVAGEFRPQLNSVLVIEANADDFIVIQGEY